MTPNAEQTPTMSRIIGIDPGMATGIAFFCDGNIVELATVAPNRLRSKMQSYMPERVIFEDSRLQSHIWTGSMAKAAAMKVARNVGQIDAWCYLITAICEEWGIPAHGISPKQKGAKLNAAQFNKVTGWAGKSNQHERDAAMVAWPYRRIAGEL